MEERYFDKEQQRIAASIDISSDSKPDYSKKLLSTYGTCLGKDWMKVYAELDWLRTRAPQEYQVRLAEIQEAVQKSQSKEAEKSELIKKMEEKIKEKQRLLEEDALREREMVIANPSIVPVRTLNQEWYKEWSAINLKPIQKELPIEDKSIKEISMDKL